jgi:putative phosphotransacetylase
MIIPVGVSKRHVHLNRDTCFKLFGTDYLEVRNNLTQYGQFASVKTVDLLWGEKVISHVRVIGPIREYNQIELSDDECEFLGVFPPARQSGDLTDSLPITLMGPCGKVSLNSGLIKAERHIHLTENDAKRLNLVNKEEVNVFKNNEFICTAIIKVSSDAYNELHIDTVEEKEFNLHQGDIVEFLKKETK